MGRGADSLGKCAQSPVYEFRPDAEGEVDSIRELLRVVVSRCRRRRRRPIDPRISRSGGVDSLARNGIRGNGINNRGIPGYVEAVIEEIRIGTRRRCTAVLPDNARRHAVRNRPAQTSRRLIVELWQPSTGKELIPTAREELIAGAGNEFVPSAGEELITGARNPFIPSAREEFVASAGNEFIPFSRKELVSLSGDEFVASTWNEFVPCRLEESNLHAGAHLIEPQGCPFVEPSQRG